MKAFDAGSVSGRVKSGEILWEKRLGLEERRRRNVDWRWSMQGRGERGVDLGTGMTASGAVQACRREVVVYGR